MCATVIITTFIWCRLKYLFPFVSVYVVVERFRQYVDPEEQSHTDGTTEGSHVSLPLDDSVLSHNLGLPLIVVGTKSDAFPHLEKEHGYKEEHYDFIQQNIRKFCLKCILFVILLPSN